MTGQTVVERTTVSVTTFDDVFSRSGQSFLLDGQAETVLTRVV